jgi:hypothetical protein
MLPGMGVAVTTRKSKSANKIRAFAAILLAASSSAGLADSSPDCINSSDQVVNSHNVLKRVCHYACPDGTKPTETFTVSAGATSCPKTIVQGAAQKAAAEQAAAKASANKTIKPKQ